MELIVISDTKLKVILTEEEMESYGLIGEGEEEPPRTAVERLLADIRRLSGVDAVNARVLVQLWRDRSGGGEMFVTRLSGTGTGGRREEYRLRRGRVLYSFDGIAAMTAACRVLAGRAYGGVSDAYRGEDGVWYLSLEDEDDGEEPGILGVLSEYGVRRSGTVLTFLTEHARLIARGSAVDALAPLAR